MSTSTEALTNVTNAEVRRNNYFSKYFIQKDFITMCFSKDFDDSRKEIGKHIPNERWSLPYKEIEISNEGFIPGNLTESELVPTQLLEHHYQIVQEKEEAEAWLRLWANSVESYEDFEEGLPGYEGNIQCTQAKEIHNELKQSPTFDSLLVRYGVYQLLEEK